MPQTARLTRLPVSWAERAGTPCKKLAGAGFSSLVANMRLVVFRDGMSHNCGWPRAKGALLHVCPAVEAASNSCKRFLFP
eukprot:11380764-Karenia_brevis.AAC.1